MKRFGNPPYFDLEVYAKYESPTSTGADPSTPRAYLNFILFDENFGIEDFGFQQVTDAGATAHELLSLHVKIERKGYLYVYLSNEQTVQTNVYWDDFRIVRHTGWCRWRITIRLG